MGGKIIKFKRSLLCINYDAEHIQSLQMIVPKMIHYYWEPLLSKIMLNLLSPNVALEQQTDFFHMNPVLLEMRDQFLHFWFPYGFFSMKCILGCLKLYFP